MERIKKTVLFTVIITIFVSIFSYAAPAEKKPAQNQPAVNCASCVLMEAQSGKVLFEKEKENQLAMASITKLMVLLLTMEKVERGELSLDETLVGSQKAKDTEGSTMFIDVGEELTINDVLKGICISSANDGAVAMAEKIAGSEEKCVEMMNARAAELGMNNTHYVNVTGFDADSHYSSAYDIALLCREILDNHPKLLEYSSIKEEWIRDGKTQLLNTNKLLKRYQYTTGLKTGTETNAKYCVAATAENAGMKLIAVVLGAPDDNTRFESAKSMLEFGYDKYQLTAAVQKGDDAGNVKVNKGAKGTVAAVVSQDVSIVMEKSAAAGIKKEVSLENKVTAPVTAGTKIGTMTVSADGADSTTVDLVAAEDVKKASFFQALMALVRSIFKI